MKKIIWLGLIAAIAIGVNAQTAVPNARPSFWPATLVDFAQVVGAIATSAAVIVSLYIAFRQPRPKLIASAGLRIVVTQNNPQGPHPEIIMITVTNVGSSDAVVRSIGWKLPRPFKNPLQAYQDVTTPDPSLPNPKLPARLAHGEELQFMMACYGPFDWFRNIADRGLFPEGIKSRRNAERLRLLVSTSVGKPTLGAVEDQLVSKIWDHQSKYLSSTKAQAKP